MSALGIDLHALIHLSTKEEEKGLREPEWSGELEDAVSGELRKMSKRRLEEVALAWAQEIYWLTRPGAWEQVMGEVATEVERLSQMAFDLDAAIDNLRSISGHPGDDDGSSY